MKRALAVLALLVAPALATVSVTDHPATDVALAAATAPHLGDPPPPPIPANVTPAQADLLRFARLAASEAGLRDVGLFQGMLLQESRAGADPAYRVVGAGRDTLFGVMQVTLGAARDVLAARPALYAKHGLQTRTDDEVKAHLILDDRFNIRVAAHYLAGLQKRFGFTGLRLANAYNRGPGGVAEVGDDWHYGRGAAAKGASLRGL